MKQNELEIIVEGKPLKIKEFRRFGNKEKFLAETKDGKVYCKKGEENEYVFLYDNKKPMK